MPRKPVNAGVLAKDPTETHRGFAEYIEKTTGHVVPVGDVACVLRLYSVFLKSPAVVKAREAEAAAKAAAEKAKADAKAQVLRDRLAKVEEQRQKLLRELGIETDDSEQDPSSPALHIVSAEPEVVEPEVVEAEVVEEPEAITLGETADEFVDLAPDEDDGDEWGDDTSDEEDF